MRSAGMRSDGTAVTAFLRAVRRRLLADGAMRGAALGLAVALPLVLLLWIARGYADESFRAAAMAAAAAAAATGAAIGAWRRRHGALASRAAEASLPASRNLITTAGELAARGGGGAIAGAIMEDAAALLDRVPPRRVQPLSRGAVMATMAAAAWLLALTAFTQRPASLPQFVAGERDAPRILDVDVVVLPPAYVGGAPVRLTDPERVEALAGSRLQVTVRAAASVVLMENVAGGRALEAATARTFTTEVRVEGDDFVAFEPRGGDGAAGVRRMFGITALRDQPPRVTIVTPGRDLILPTPDSVLLLEIETEDDHAVASLALRYTRVTGFGEQFTFVEGDVPLEVTRQGARRWTARARWPLAALELERGDMVVYRAIATDRRPGGAAAESDTYMVEIGDANVAAAGGFSVEEDPDRYALSQQMLIVLTERLMARRGSMDPAAFAAEARTLAAAQRRVRAEFIFMLGGELSDGEEHGADPDHAGHDHDEMTQLHEEAHARADLDVLEGRMGSQGRGELVRAIRSMSHAATLLTDVNMEEALRAEQTALLFLQRAFSRSRYILRAFTERERLDLERRLTGSLADVASHARPRREEPVDSATVALRRILADAAASSAGGGGGQDAAALARAVLAVDGTDPVLQEVAALLADAAAAHSARRGADARARLDEAVMKLGRHVRLQLRPAPLAAPLELLRLDGALTDALRRSGAR
jgi:hypothetical protein